MSILIHSLTDFVFVFIQAIEIEKLASRFLHEIYKVHNFMLKYKKLNKQVNELISLDKTQTARHQSA